MSKHYGFFSIHFIEILTVQPDTWAEKDFFPVLIFLAVNLYFSEISVL